MKLQGEIFLEPEATSERPKLGTILFHVHLNKGSLDIESEDVKEKRMER